MCSGAGRLPRGGPGDLSRGGAAPSPVGTRGERSSAALPVLGVLWRPLAAAGSLLGLQSDPRSGTSLRFVLLGL